MKIEVLHQRQQRHGLTPGDRLIGYLPRYARHASRLRWLLHLRERLPGPRRAAERLLGISAQRSLPRWHARPWRGPANGVAPAGDGRDVALLVDTFTTSFEPGVARAAEAVLRASARASSTRPAARKVRPQQSGRPPPAAGRWTR